MLRIEVNTFFFFDFHLALVSQQRESFYNPSDANRETTSVWIFLKKVFTKMAVVDGTVSGNTFKGQ